LIRTFAGPQVRRRKSENSGGFAPPGAAGAASAKSSPARGDTPARTISPALPTTGAGLRWEEYTMKRVVWEPPKRHF